MLLSLFTLIQCNHCCQDEIQKKLPTDGRFYVAWIIFHTHVISIIIICELSFMAFDQPVISLINLLYPQASSNSSASQQRPTFGLSPFTQYFAKYNSGFKFFFFHIISCVQCLLFYRTWRQVQVPQRQWEEGWQPSSHSLLPFLIFSRFICFWRVICICCVE